MQATKPQFQSKLYVLAAEELVSNSPYKVEGTDVVLDIPGSRNVPWRYNITTDDGEKVIRYIRGCSSIFLTEQIAMGFPADRQPTREEMSDLIFNAGQLYAGRKNLAEYLDVLPLNKESPNRDNARNFYRTVNEQKDQKEAYELELSKAKAKAAAFTMADGKVKDLLRLRYHGFVNEGTSEMEAKMQLSRMIDEEHGDINGLAFFQKHTTETESELDAVTILARKCLEKNIISLVTLPGSVGILNKGKWEPMAKISEEGGEAAQFNRVADWLQTTDGKPYIAILTTKLKAAKAAEE